MSVWIVCVVSLCAFRTEYLVSESTAVTVTDTVCAPPHVYVYVYVHVCHGLTSHDHPVLSQPCHE